jgi:hypothetical protein
MLQPGLHTAARAVACYTWQHENDADVTSERLQSGDEFRNLNHLCLPYRLALNDRLPGTVCIFINMNTIKLLTKMILKQIFDLLKGSRITTFILEDKNIYFGEYKYYK